VTDPFIDRITLTPQQIALATGAAMARYDHAKGRGWNSVLPADKVDDRKGGILGAKGELAAALVLGVPWNGATVGVLAGPDLDKNLQIRTRSRHLWDLLVRDTDKDEDWFVLVTSEDGLEFWLRGCILCRRAKEFPMMNIGGYGLVHVITANELCPIELLAGYLEARRARRRVG
jgi:hypothetical protein